MTYTTGQVPDVAYCQSPSGGAPPATSSGASPGENAGCQDNCPGVGNPVNPGTGNKLQVELDYAGAGPFPLALRRTYNSQMAVGGALGAVWTHNYARSVQQYAPSWVLVSRADGKQRRYNLISGTWTPIAAGTEQLQQVQVSLSGSGVCSGTQTGWVVRNAQDETETYNAAGQLCSIANRAGLTQTLSYDSTGNFLLGVSDGLGRSLGFVYDTQQRIAIVNDPAGQAYTFSYDTHNNLVSVKYPDAALRQYVYGNSSFPNALTGIIDENGARYATYAYDAQGRATSTQHGNGAELYTLAYNGDGTTTVTDPLGTQRTYGFGTTLGVVRNTSLVQPCASCTGGTSSASRSYDANGNLASFTDFNGNRSNLTWDSTRNLQTQRVEGLTSSGAGTAATRTTSTRWHPVWQLPAAIAEPRRITTYTYDTRGNLASRSIQATTDLAGASGFSATATGSARTWTYANTYSGTIPGLLVAQVITGPLAADTTTLAWDSAGNLSSVTNALGQATSYSGYDAHGRPQQVTDANGLVTTLAYDLRGRLLSRADGAETTTYAYDPAGQLIKVTLPDGATLSYSYDTAHRLTRIQDAAGDAMVYTLDAMGNRTQESVYDPAGTLRQVRSRAFDALNRLQKDIGGVNPATEITQYAYDAQGNLSSITDALGNLTTRGFDPLNRITSISAPVAGGDNADASNATVGVTRLAYDGLDQISQLTDPRGNATRYTVDGLGNLTGIVSPDAGTATNTYDVAGNLLTHQDGRTVGTTSTALTWTYSYDALKRVTGVSFNDGVTPAIAFSYDAYDPGTNPGGRGHLTQMTDATGTTTWTYDLHGRVLTRTQAIPNIQALSVQYAYGTTANSAGKVSQITYPSGLVMSYGYDAAGRIQSVNAGAGSASAPLLGNIAYQPFVGPVAGTWATGAAFSRSYDLDGRVSGYLAGAVNRTLGYDAAGRIVSMTPAGQTASSYTYDNLDRLTAWVWGTTIQGYSYDLNGNRTGFNNAGSATYTISPTSNRIVATTGVVRSFTYDAAGNRVNDGTNTWGYDARGRMIWSNNGSLTTSYAVNGLGQRTVKGNTTLGTLYFVYDEQGHLLGEYEPGLVQEYIWAGDLLVSVYKNGVYNGVETDQLGAPRQVFNGSQQTVWQWDPVALQ